MKNTTAFHSVGSSIRCGTVSVWRRFAAFDLTSPQWRFVARSTLAAVLALVVAFELSLETPYSAATTVLLVASSTQGAVLAKGLWRLLGTLIGAISAVVLMGLFVQTPFLFLFGFGLWLGVCACAATVLRHFRASGAAVAGYTVGLATYGALEMPERLLDSVLGRTATVAIGVLSLGVVTALLSGRSTRAKLEGALTTQLADLGRLIAASVRVGVSSPAKPDMVAGMFTIDDLLELSSAESPDIAIKAGGVREGLASLFGAVLGMRALPIPSSHDAPVLVTAREIVAERLPEIADLIEDSGRGPVIALGEIADVRHKMHDRERVAEAEASPETLVQLDRLLEIIEDYEAALISLVRLKGRTPYRRRTSKFRFHRDWNGGIRNGARAMLAILCGGAFGIATGWIDWSLMTLILAPYVVLLAMIGNPEAGAISFIKGTVAAVPAACLCAFGLLPAIDGLPLLLVVIVPFWIAGLYCLTKPRFAPAALAYLVTFNTLTAASNPMTWDPAAFLNQAFGWIAAVSATWLAFRLILPHQPHRQAERLASALWRDVLAVIANGAPEGRAVWEHLQHHRLVRIAQSVKGDPAFMALLLSRGLDDLHIGRTALRLRYIRNRHIRDDPAIEASLAALSKIKQAPRTASTLLHATAMHIAASNPASQAARQAKHRAIAGLIDIATLLERRGARPC